jgi:hypothetical protein
MRHCILSALLLCTVLLLPALAAALSGVPAAVVPPTGDAAIDAAAALDPPRFTVVSSGAGGVTLEFEMPAYSIADVGTESGTFQEIAIPRGGYSGDVGAPQIPIFARLVQIPERAGVRVSVEIEEEETINDIRLLPVQPDEGGPFAMDQAAYARDDFGAVPAAQVGSPVILRDLRTVALTLQPVRYNPATRTLKVARRIRIGVTYAGEDLENAMATNRAPRPYAPSFDALYRNLVVNYSGPPADRGVEQGGFLIISPDNPQVTARLQPLISWKQRKGWPVVLATTAQTGTSATQIKAYIQNAYDTWPVPPEYICMVGDADGSIAIPPGSGQGDHAYVQLDGTDVLADAHIGRLSVSSLNELEAVVNKSVGYESNPWLQDDPGWFTRASLVGDPSASGLSVIQVQQFIKNRLREIGYTQIDTIYSGNFVNQIQTSLNRGDTIFSYRGYYGMSGWSNANTNTLANGWKMPFVVTITCGTGTWISGTSVTEGFLRACATTISPKGGIGAIGTATTGTHTKYNNCIHCGIFWGLLYEDQTTMGAALTRGKLEMYLNYGAHELGTVLTWCTWNNLMGDPSLDVFTGAPVQATVIHHETIPFGSNSMVVSVENAGIPISGAQVCALKGGETRSVGTTDANGVIEIPLTNETPGDLMLTVTKHGEIPYLATIPVAAPDRFVGYSTSTIDDDAQGESNGNGNRQVNPLETIEMPVQLHNFGTEDASAVTATLTCNDPYVTITDATEEYGDLPAGAIAWSPDDFGFTVDGGCPNGRVLRFGLDIASGGNVWHSLIDVPVVSADLTASGMTIYDPSGNGILDPGETIQLSVKLKNDGQMIAGDVVGMLVADNGMVAVADARGGFGSIPPGVETENSTDRFSVTAASDAYAGGLATFKLITVFSGGIRDTATVTLTIGTRAQTDPIGPDHYGYYCFDDTDRRHPEAPTYQWIEIDPTHGGTGGVAVPLTDHGNYQDDTKPVDLPFTFRYYGRDYNRVSVCSNGWVALGWCWLNDYRNWTIPGAGGPNGMICGFWDDLRLVTGAGVYTRYDEAAHRFIIEYSRVQNEPYGEQTFEIILLDPAFFPSSTGDGTILIQYDTVTNNDAGDNYATVGIESPDGFDGLLYTYYGDYPTGAAPLQAGRAIVFVPRGGLTDVPGGPGSLPAEPARFALLPTHPNPVAGVTAFSFSLERSGAARLALYDVQGRLVRTLVEGIRPAGWQIVSWDGLDRLGAAVPPGVYFYRLTAAADGDGVGSRTQVRKLVRIE